jgi:hypothetical protein
MSKLVLRYHDGLEVPPISWENLKTDELSPDEQEILASKVLGEIRIRADRPLPVMFWPTRMTVERNGEMKWFSHFPGLYNEHVFCKDLQGSQLEAGSYIIPVRENISKHKRRVPSIGWAAVVATLQLDGRGLQALFEPWPVSGKEDWRIEVNNYVSSTIHNLLSKAVQFLKPSEARNSAGPNA